MAVATTNISMFHLFMNLALELRDQIWRAALPDEIGPLLYFYQNGSWCPRPLLPSDEGYGYDPENDDSTMKFEFRHDLLDSVQLEIPLFFVNREARNIAQAWIREHGIEIRVYNGIDRQLQSPVFVSPFDPVYDALYIAVDKLDEFLCEPDDRYFQTDMVERFIHVHPANITSIVMPEALFRGEGEVAAGLAELMDRFFGQLKVLFVMVDTPLDLQPANNGMKMQPRWELENIQGGGAFCWNHERGRFDFNESEYILEGALYKLIEEINKSLGEQLVKNSIRSFEVRPVFVVRT